MSKFSKLDDNDLLKSIFKDGEVAFYDIKVERLAIEITDTAPIATPANRVPGQDVIVGLGLNDDEAKEKFGDIDIKLPHLRFTKA
jgi:hypothetical protein